MRGIRNRRNNPFQPGWGKPLVWAGRRGMVEEFTDVVLPRVSEGVKETPRLVQHERGMGKTALLEVLRDEASERGCLVTLTTAVRGENFTKALARDLSDRLADHSMGVRVTGSVRQGLARLGGIDIGPVAAHLRSEDDTDIASSVLRRTFVEVAEVARGDGTQLVVLIDEVQNVGELHLAAVFTALQQALERTVEQPHPAGGRLRLALPIAVWVAGLPGSLAQFKKARVTFGERCELVDFGPLDERDVREVLITFGERNDAGVVFDADAIDRFVAEVHGYPYAFQLLGKAAWDASPGPVVTVDDVAAGAEATRPSMAERYAARLSGLTEEQIAYLIAAASLPREARTPTATCRRYRGDPSASASQCGGMSQRLIDDHQVLRVGADSRYELSLPGMEDYLRRLVR